MLTKKNLTMAAIALSMVTLTCQAFANDEGNPFYSITCGNARACAQEASFVPGQQINLGVVMVDHLIIDADDNSGTSLVIPTSETGNVDPAQGSLELRFNDGRPAVTLGTVTLVDKDARLYAIQFSPTVAASIATIGQGKKTECDPGGVFGAVDNVFAIETNRLTLKLPANQTVTLQTYLKVKQIGSHPALLGCR